MYINQRYSKLKRLVSTTHRVEYIVNANNIDTITIEFVVINNFKYPLVNSFISENSFLKIINNIDIETTTIVSVK